MAIARFTVDDNVIDTRMNQMVDEVSLAIGQNTSDLNAHKADYTTHKNKKVSQVGTFTRDAQIIGTQKITLPFKAKTITIFASVFSSVGKTSWGIVDENLSNIAMFDYDVAVANSYQGSADKCVYINQGNNETMGQVTLIEDDGFTITWSKNGTGATGTIVLLFSATTH